MCLIIYKPQAVKIPSAMIKKAWTSNHDGAGIMVSMGDHFYFNKGFFSIKALLSELKKFEGHRVAIHLRLATHGAVTSVNCHPFVVDTRKIRKTNGTAKELLMHNGILQAYGDADSSDTWHFAREALAPLAFKARDNILKAIPGKFCYGHNGKFNMYGMEEHKESGCYVSNKHWDYSTKQYGMDYDWGVHSSRGSYRHTGASLSVVSPTAETTERQRFELSNMMPEREIDPLAPEVEEPRKTGLMSIAEGVLVSELPDYNGYD